MKIAVSIIVLFIIVASIFIMSSNKQEQEFSFMRVNGTEIALELARTIEEKRKGLSERDSLLKNTGMLFLYDVPRVQSFWMKDMRFAIDILWIDKEGIIVGIEENASPDSYPTRFRSPELVPYVIEVNAGWVREHEVSVGDKVGFQ